jgi:hypothetical protein
MNMEWIAAHYNEILAAIGAVVTAASAIIALTPSTKDDEVLGKIMLLVEKFSIFNKRTK